MGERLHSPLADGLGQRLESYPVMTELDVRRLLEPFKLELSSSQIAQLLEYLKLLLKWNRKMNLTAIRTPEACVTRHFGESLYLARWTTIEGRLLDIGSGAGFPGLALKIAFPWLAVTLLEPVAKKRAFLKEVARTCGIESVEVRGERLQDFLRQDPDARFDAATARAVGHVESLAGQAAKFLAPGSRLYLWLSAEQGARLARTSGDFKWDPPIPLPLARQREIWIGVRK